MQKLTPEFETPEFKLRLWIAKNYRTKDELFFLRSQTGTDGGNIGVVAGTLSWEPEFHRSSLLCLCQLGHFVQVT